MNYRQLGKSELIVSEVSFGCMSLSGDHFTNKRLLHEALDSGINFFDTADLYARGENEITVGRALKDFRKQVYLATKVGNQWKEDGSGWIWNPRKDYILKAVMDSLKRLQTDYIDLYQLHGGTIDDPIDETIEAFEILKKDGVIREYGISSIRPNVIKEYVKKSNIVSVMTQYSLLDRRPEEFTLSFLREHRVGVLVRGALAKGLLVDKPPQAYLSHSVEEVSRVQDELRNSFSRFRTQAQTAIRFCLEHKAVSTVVAGASNRSQLLENVGASDSEPLSGEEAGKLGKLTKTGIYESHR